MVFRVQVGVGIKHGQKALDDDYLSAAVGILLDEVMKYTGDRLSTKRAGHEASHERWRAKTPPPQP